MFLRPTLGAQGCADHHGHIARPLRPGNILWSQPIRLREKIIQPLSIVFYSQWLDGIQITIDDMFRRKHIHLKSSQQVFLNVQFIKRPGRHPQIPFDSQRLGIVMQIDHLVEGLLSKLIDQQGITPLPQMQPIDIGIVLQYRPKRSFGQYMNLGAGHLLLQATNNGGGEDNVTN